MRLIDADKLIELFSPFISEDKKVIYHPRSLKIDDIKNAPTVDAVEVVRCKDCKFAQKELFSKTLSCKVWGDKFSPEDFCSTGKMRD